MARGPSYTAEEDELMFTLAKDTTLSHNDRVEQFFARISGPSDRTRDAISQKLRKLVSSLNKKAPSVKKSATKIDAKAPASKPAKKTGAVVAVGLKKSVNGNGNGNGHAKKSDIEVSFDGVTLRGAPGKVGAMLAQLAG